ncbi:type II toxin-antitoxin system RelE/ParE family toxin [Roseospira navarrensis]|uniref:Plasmid maintenance system killer protein n=1 Tax=Roseospira navarrensis TaxID=140058 RepID=A0A7X1ZED2_9PROT|nr:type II toxin-antitoxin system RelE/ParE family toxin [Roseospira navarrensis]MQX36762.1 plasmid maintenance system killer protein [Roseospira navarrensis]
MIRSYRDKATRLFAEGEFVKRFQSIEAQASTRLSRLNAATGLNDLRQQRGNRLESLGGDRAGQYSIRVNDQWRICFEWPDDGDGPVNVELVDDHH